MTIEVREIEGEGRKKMAWALKTMVRLWLFLRDVKPWRVEKRGNLRALRHKVLLRPCVEGRTRTRTGRLVGRPCNYSSPRWQGVGDQGVEPWLGSGSNFNSRAECGREFKVRLAIKSCVFLWAQASIRYRGKCNGLVLIPARAKTQQWVQGAANTLEGLLVPGSC